MHCRFTRLGSCGLVMLLAAVTANATPRNVPTPPATNFAVFESGQVRPLAMSLDGKFLYALNTPDSRLEIFEINKMGGLTPAGSVLVGLEPVAVAARSNTEVWVVNHVSDSISIVDVSKPLNARVVRTLLVGDEPRDIVFAGANRSRAFITTAHRGQNSPIDPQLTTPSVGRADVWVFDAGALGTALGGTPLKILTLFTDTPRALAVTPDGAHVYAAGFQTGNKTTAVTEQMIPDGGVDNGGLPSTRVDAAGVPQPETGLIVRFNGAHWVDELGRTWDDAVRFNLPDKDVFVIDAMATPPAAVDGFNGFFAGVGTVLFNMIVNPQTGAVYVSNTDARNDTRFEGPGSRLGHDHTVQGHFVENRITVIKNGSVAARHLNKHINYSVCCAASPNAESKKSLAQPMDMAISNDGRRLYVAAFGSSKVGIFDTAQLENNTFTPDSKKQITVSGGGPSGIVLDEVRNRLYVLTRFDNAVSTIDLKNNRELGHVPMYNPEPTHVVNGRRFLYDATLTSSHGDSACGSCHIFGDFDSLAWDLGNPDETTVNNPGPYALGPVIPSPAGGFITPSPHFAALKGPMATQSLRGMANHGPMHWRGDRTGGNDAASAQPDSGTFDEQAAFKAFNVAFEGLVGRNEPLAPEEMQAFTDFILEIMYPPNPIRQLDNSLTEDQTAARAMYFGTRSDTFFNCNTCHVLNPDANKEYGVSKPGFFGTDGRYSFESLPQFFKVPHLRNMYQKVGMFGGPNIPLFIPGNNENMGDQIRGFGFLHDGSVDTPFRFFHATLFAARPAGTLSPADPGNPGGFLFAPPTHPLAPLLNSIGDNTRRQMESFIFAFDSNFAPIVGQQITYRGVADAAVEARIALLKARAEARECDLIVRGRLWSNERGYLYMGNGLYRSDIGSEALQSEAAIRLTASRDRAALTYTCVPPGSGQRFGIDRDNDGILDFDDKVVGVRKR